MNNAFFRWKWHLAVSRFWLGMADIVLKMEVRAHDSDNHGLFKTFSKACDRCHKKYNENWMLACEYRRILKDY